MSVDEFFQATFEVRDFLKPHQDSRWVTIVPRAICKPALFEKCAPRVLQNWVCESHVVGSDSHFASMSGVMVRGCEFFKQLVVLLY
jgi:hypothetical protein